MTNNVFVYGTLKSGSGGVREIHTLGDPVFVGEAKTDALWTMWRLEGFPAIVPGGQDIVLGQVWEVEKSLLALLDMIEGYPAFYRRQIIETTQGPAWAYYMSDPEQYGGTPMPAENGIAEWKGETHVTA